MQRARAMLPEMIDDNRSVIARLIGPSPVWLRPGAELKITERTKCDGMEHELELTIYHAPAATLPVDFFQAGGS